LTTSKSLQSLPIHRVSILPIHLRNTMTAHDLDVSSLFNVKGKIVLITGGGSGIGKAMALGFSQNGAKVYIASRKEKQLQETVEEINAVSTGGKAEYILADIGSKAGCDALISEFRKRENKLHVLINNSATSWAAPYSNYDESGWDRILAVNVKSVFFSPKTPIIKIQGA